MPHPSQGVPHPGQPRLSPNMPPLTPQSTNISSSSLPHAPHSMPTSSPHVPYSMPGQNQTTHNAPQTSVKLPAWLNQVNSFTARASGGSAQSQVQNQPQAAAHTSIPGPSVPPLQPASDVAPLQVASRAQHMEHGVLTQKPGLSATALAAANIAAQMAVPGMNPQVRWS